ncbi:MAG: DNA-binding protein [Chloroflexi bacterium]|nr:DNA-binding protein [Chloroflexota bacterium]
MSSNIPQADPRFVEQVDLSDVILTRFQPGDDLFQMLTKTVKDRGWERAVIISGIGSLEDVVFVAPKPAFSIPVKPAENLNRIEMKGPFELMSVEGNIVPLVGEFGNLKHGDPVLHIHCLLSHGQGELTGGHMVAAKVFTTTEIFIANVKNSNVKKKKSEVTGLMEFRNDL